MTYEELDIGNGTVYFSVSDPLSVMLTIFFKIWPYLKIIDFFNISWFWPNSLYFGNLEDFGKTMWGTFFAHKVIADFRISKPFFESEQNLKIFLYHATP